MKVYYKKLNPNAQPPSKGTPGSVGWDLRAAEPAVLSDRGPVLVKTGLAVACPPGLWLKLFDRSSMAMGGVTISAGVIDTDYRGEIGIVMSARGIRQVAVGDKVAQLVVMPHMDTEFADVPESWEWVEATDEEWASLSNTERGEGGFGSTGR